MKIIAMYILECANKTYYVGSTRDLQRRLEEHNSGMGANYTRKHLPIKLIFYEEFNRVDDAYYRECQVKNWSSKKKIALLNSDKNSLKLLSKGRERNE